MMAESKFTKGPWVAEQHRDCGIFRIKAGEENIASLSFWDESNEEANAELMADAPRVLEVLRTLHDFALPLRDRGLAAESEQAFADARALLEKHGG
jgi:hypothetical protein